MGRYQLWTLRRRGDDAGPPETRRLWIEEDTPDRAMAQAAVIAETTLSGWSGVAMLTNEAGAVIWSSRKDMPRPGKPGDPVG